MKLPGTMQSAILSLIATIVLALPLLTPPAQAQDRRAMREHEHERTRFQTQHWAWDSRFNHNHYYPAVGYAVPSLPIGRVAIDFRGGRLYFHSGVWFRFSGGRYLVVRPPLGAVIPVLPVGYTQMWAGGVPYYYANEVYYAQMPQGYVVTDPPADANWQAQAPQQQYAPAPSPQIQPQPQYGMPQGSPAQPAPGTWYYCDSARAYYPYIGACAEGWRTVPATPPSR